MICTSTVRDTDDTERVDEWTLFASNRFWEDETDTPSGISFLSYFHFWYDIDCLFDVCFDREMLIFDYKLDFIQSKKAKKRWEVITDPPPYYLSINKLETIFLVPNPAQF